MFPWESTIRPRHRTEPTGDGDDGEWDHDQLRVHEVGNEHELVVDEVVHRGGLARGDLSAKRIREVAPRFAAVDGLLLTNVHGVVAIPSLESMSTLLQNSVDRIRIAPIARDHSALRVGNEGMGRADDGGNADAGKSVLPRLEEFHTFHSGIAALRSRPGRSATSHASQTAMARTNRNTRDLRMI